MGPDEHLHLQGYAPNTPIITFDSAMTLHVGNHTFRMTHMPGHTKAQAAVSVVEEGVTFTSDNIFCKVHTWIQGGDPNEVAGALEACGRCRRTRSCGTRARAAGYLQTSGWDPEWIAYVRAG